MLDQKDKRMSQEIPWESRHCWKIPVGQISQVGNVLPSANAITEDYQLRQRAPLPGETLERSTAALEELARTHQFGNFTVMKW